jgi:cyanate permease
MNQKAAVSVVFVLSMFVAIVDITIVNVALPTLGRDFGVAADNVDTVTVGFLVSLAVFIPASGWLGDRFGTKRVVLAAIVIFSAERLPAENIVDERRLMHRSQPVTHHGDAGKRTKSAG